MFLDCLAYHQQHQQAAAQQHQVVCLYYYHGTTSSSVTTITFPSSIMYQLNPFIRLCFAAALLGLMATKLAKINVSI